MKTSPAGRKAIAQREGVRLKAYRCSAGVLTIGAGHTSMAGAPRVTEGMTITRAECDEILSRDLAKFESAVLRAVKVRLSQNEFDALVSLAFNIGGSAFAKSSAVRKLNAGDRLGAANALLAWNKVGRNVAPGLVTRRQAERKQFLAPDAKLEAEPISPQKPPATAPVSAQPAPQPAGFFTRLARALTRKTA